MKRIDAYEARDGRVFFSASDCLGHEAMLDVCDALLRDLANATEARALAAELVRAADEVEPVTERSCFTCEHNQPDGSAFICDPWRKKRPGVRAYAQKSGMNESRDCMPTDRSIPCPGHAPKVTT